MKRILFCGIIFCLFLGVSEGDVPEDQRFVPRAMPPVSWLDADMRLDLGDTAGTHSSYSARIAVDGDRVYVVWTDNRHGPGSIYFNRSLDRGAGWMAQDMRLDKGADPGTYSATSPQIAVVGGDIYVVWLDSRNGNTDVYFNCSRDGGETWLDTDIQVDTGSINPDYADSVRVCGSAGHVYVVWADQRNGLYDVFLNRSADNGDHWSGPVRLDTGDTAGSNGSHDPDICCDGANVYVVWDDGRNGFYEDIYFNRSTDWGTTWLAGDVRLDTGDTPGANRSSSARICCSGSNLYVAWLDQRNIGYVYFSSVHFNRSLDGGSTWLGADITLETPDQSRNSVDFDICCSGTAVYVVWENIAINYSWGDILFNRSMDSGTTWFGPPLRLDRGGPPQTTRSHSPAICLSGWNLHVAYSDNRDGKTDIYLNTSADGGGAWLADDIRLDTGDDAGAHSSAGVAIACTADNVFAVWNDKRNSIPDPFGIEDIYFNTTEAAPVAHAGFDGEARVGETYTLDGHRSSDPDNDPLVFAWVLRSRPAGSTASLSYRNRSTPSFLPDAAGIYEFGLTVTDPFGESDTDRVTVTTTDLVELTLATGSGGTTLPAPGTYTYDQGESVSLIAVPDTGFVFAGWSGDAAGATNPLAVVMDADKSISAAFSALVYPPQNLAGTRIENRSLAMAEYIARLTWQAHADNIHVTGYRVVRVDGGAEVELGVAAPDAFVFEDAGVPATGTLTYRVYTLRVDGNVSDPAEVVLN